MDIDLRRKLSWITGPRAKSSQFSGLECILASPAPLFIAPVASNDAELANTVGSVAGSTDGHPSNAATGLGGAAGDGGKDKKMTRKGKKAAFAAQNRLGADVPDAY
jgi:hypothetical protein